MSETIVTSVFEVESEAYQALSEVKRGAINENYVVSQIALVKNEGGRIVTKDWFDTGVESRNDARIGGMVGALIGILGGPIGILLGSSWGYLAGSVKDAGDVESNASLIEKMSSQIIEGETALISLVQENKEGSFEAGISKWKTSTIVSDAAEIAAEIEHAQQMEKEMKKAARKQMREEKVAAGKEKIEEQRSKIKAQFEQILKKD